MRRGSAHLEERAKFDALVYAILPGNAIALPVYKLAQLQYFLQRLHLCIQSALLRLAARGRSAVLLLLEVATRHVSHIVMREGIDALPILMLLDV